MSEDDFVVYWKPHPSHLVRARPREWSLVGISLIPFLHILWKMFGREVGVDGVVIVDLPWVPKKHIVSHVLAV